MRPVYLNHMSTRMKRTPLRIEEHAQPTARWYVVTDANEKDLCTFEMDAYLTEFENSSHPDVLFVVLFSGQRGQPHFVYAPDGGLVGVPYEAAIAQALAAYRSAHPDLVPEYVVKEAFKVVPDGR